jgi:hypothetical protein
MRNQMEVAPHAAHVGVARDAALPWAAIAVGAALGR